MTLVHSQLEIAKHVPALSELQRGLVCLPEDAPDIEWVEAYWLIVDADFSSAGFVGRAADGTRLYLEVHCDDDAPEREVKAEMKVLTDGPEFPAVAGVTNGAWADDTHDLNLWLAAELRWEGEPRG